MNKKLETENFVFEEFDEGCYRATLKSTLEFTLEVAQEFDNAANEITGMQKHAMVLNATNVIYAHADAREYIQKAQEKNKTAVAAAFVAKSAIAKVAGNIFLSINRPSFPMRIFTNSIEAETWAKTKYEEYFLLL